MLLPLVNGAILEPVPSPGARSPGQQVQEAQRGWSGLGALCESASCVSQQQPLRPADEPRGEPETALRGQENLAAAQGLEDGGDKAGKRSPPVV